MSMNINIVACRDISYIDGQGNPKTEQQCVRFNAVQTSTSDTYAIMDSPDQIEAYRTYIKGRSSPVLEPVYAPDDIMREYAPIGYEEYDWTVDHLSQFDDWVAARLQDGYRINFEVM